MNTLTGTLLMTLALLSPTVWSHNDSHSAKHHYEERHKDLHHLEHYIAKKKKQKHHHRYYAHNHKARQLSHYDHHDKNHYRRSLYLTIKPIGFNRSRHHFHGFNICYSVH